MVEPGCAVRAVLNPGIVLASGATLTGEGTLTMTGFKTALTAQPGSTITDGTYVFKNNAGASGSRGLSLAGTVKGSSGKDKLTITADDKSTTNFYESVINSDYRLVYDDVSLFLDNTANNSNIYKDDVLKEKLYLMKKLDEILTIKRKNRGTLDFELPEIDISFNKDDEVENISKKINGIANRIIESFMICTNEVVGKHFGDEDIPIIYRLHPKPTEEKLEILKNYLRHLNVNIQSIDQFTSKFLSNIIDKFKDTNKSSFVNYTILRSMSKAQYSSNIDIHFGLATFLYCHFTSPIRRYARRTNHHVLVYRYDS